MNLEIKEDCFDCVLKSFNELKCNTIAVFFGV